jgi:prevent-host-death family protein
LAEGTPWPRRETRPLALLAQLNLSEAAPWVQPDEPLPRTGLLSLFVEPDALDEPGGWQLLFTAPGVELTRLPARAKLAGRNRIAAVPVTFEREMSWPPPHSAALGKVGLSWPQIAAFSRRRVDVAAQRHWRAVNVASRLHLMTPHEPPLKREVGVRELHDHLSRYVRHAAAGGEVVVTMRGRRVARLAPVSADDALADLRARGLVQEPQRDWVPGRGARATPRAPVSDLIAEQRR